MIACSEVLVQLGSLEKIGSDPETAEELPWAVFLFMALGCCDVVSHWIKKGANRRPAPDRYVGGHPLQHHVARPAPQGRARVADGDTGRQGSCLMTVALNGAANNSDRGA